MIIIINGSLGVGKSSVADELHWKFDKSVHLDADYIGDVHPFEIYDDARIDHLYRTLELLVGFHQKNGYRNFVINYVFEFARFAAGAARPFAPARSGHSHVLVDL